MTARFAHIRRLTAIREAVSRSPEDTDMILRRAIVDALPQQYRQIYDWIGQCYAPVTSTMVMTAWGLKHSHASTLLKELWEFGLLTRTQESDAYGTVYKYEIAP